MTRSLRLFIFVICAIAYTQGWSQLPSPDFFPLAVGNSWTYFYNVSDNQQLGDAYMADSGFATYTVRSNSPSPDSIVWHLREVRDVLHSYIFLFDHSRDTVFALKDSTDFDLIEYCTGNHRLLRKEATSSCWKSVFPLTGDFSDSTKFFRFLPTADQDTFSLLASNPAINPYEHLHLTFHRSFGIEEISYSLQVVGQTSSTHHVLNHATVTSVQIGRGVMPGADFVLGANYPNPFNPQTTIPFAMMRSSRVSIVIYDMLGRVVETLTDDILGPGNHSVIWNATSKSSGTYFCTVRAERFTKTFALQYIK